MKSAKSFPAAVALIALTVLAGGCAFPERIQPGSTTSTELVTRLGQPTEKRNAPGGSESWDYVYGPEGVQSWRFGIDSKGMVVSATPLLTEERLRRIIPGVSTQADVLELLGKPRDITRYATETTWEWRVRINPQYGTYVVRFGADGKATGYNILMDMIIDGTPDT